MVVVFERSLGLILRVQTGLAGSALVLTSAAVAVCSCIVLVWLAVWVVSYIAVLSRQQVKRLELPQCSTPQQSLKRPLRLYLPRYCTIGFLPISTYQFQENTNANSELSLHSIDGG